MLRIKESLCSSCSLSRQHSWIRSINIDQFHLQVGPVRHVWQSNDVECRQVLGLLNERREVNHDALLANVEELESELWASVQFTSKLEAVDWAINRVGRVELAGVL